MQLSKKSLKKLRAALLEITPEVTAILDDFTKVNNLRAKPGEMSEEDAAVKGVEIIKEFIDMLLVRQYDGILRVLAALYEVTIEELEEKEVGEIVEMVIETLQDEALLRFFPRSRLLTRKMQSAI